MVPDPTNPARLFRYQMLSSGDPVAATAAVYDARTQEFAGNWDRLPARAHHPVTDLLQRLVPGSRVLDVGAGSGRDLAQLSAAGHHVVGMDRSRGLAAIASRRGAVVVADVRAVPLPDGSMDGVLASASLLHLEAADLPVGLAEVRRVLRDRGVFVLSLKEGDGTYLDKAGRHFTLWRGAALDALLQAAGFDVVDAGTDPDQLHQPIPWLRRTCLAV